MLRDQPERDLALTTGERSALRWLTAVAVLGSGAQLYRHWRHSGDSTPLSAEALSRQLVAVDSAQRAGRRTTPGARAGYAGRRQMGGRSLAGAGSATSVQGGSPGESAQSRRRSSIPMTAALVPTLGPVDIDHADSATLERLPRIGPALAARIVADRSAKGPYGSLNGLQRVRGIGPKLAGVLGPLVTFSGIPRPSSVHR